MIRALRLPLLGLATAFFLTCISSPLPAHLTMIRVRNAGRAPVTADVVVGQHTVGVVQLAPGEEREITVDRSSLRGEIRIVFIHR